LKQPYQIPNTLKGFFTDPWEIYIPPKGSIKTLPHFHFVFQIVPHPGVLQPLQNFAIHFKGLGRDLMKMILSKQIWHLHTKIVSYLNLIKNLKIGKNKQFFLLQASQSKMALNQSGFTTDPWGVEEKRAEIF
jgi:hypothetical protein